MYEGSCTESESESDIIVTCNFELTINQPKYTLNLKDVFGFEKHLEFWILNWKKITQPNYWLPAAECFKISVVRLLLILHLENLFIKSTGVQWGKAVLVDLDTPIASRHPLNMTQPIKSNLKSRVLWHLIINNNIVSLYLLHSD